MSNDPETFEMGSMGSEGSVGSVGSEGSEGSVGGVSLRSQSDSALGYYFGADTSRTTLTGPDNSSHDRTVCMQVMPQTVSTKETTRIRQADDSRSVKRRLRGIHLFMITINGTLGTGLYMRSGQIVELGGPVAVVSSLIILGLLAWAVMQCITELLCLWPIPGALPLFVRRFVDQELGIAVGITYWFTYSIGFAALIASAATILNYWIYGLPALTVSMVYIALPIILVLINMLEIGWYGLFELVTGGTKIAFLIVIMLCLIVTYSRCINPQTERSWQGRPEYDEEVSIGYFQTLMMCFSIATFAYTGVEIVAASAIEACWSPSSNSVTDGRATQLLRKVWSFVALGYLKQLLGIKSQATDGSKACAENQTTEDPPVPTEQVSGHRNHTNQEQASVRNTIQVTAAFVPIFVAVVYTLSGLLVSLGLHRDHCDLPRLSWTPNKTCPVELNTTGSSYSPFIIVAKGSNIRGLDHVFNAFLAFTALTCANTNLYVASRTLFGMAKNVRDAHWGLRAFAFFGETNRASVPIRAVILSAVAFCWVPLLQIPEDYGASFSLAASVEVLAQMGSVSVLIVWTCLCLAYIRFYHCIKKHEAALEHAGIRLKKQRDGISGQYPYRSHFQPFLAYMALAGCLAILTICNGAFLWAGFSSLSFLCAYLTLILFLAVWLVLKVCHGFPRGFSFFVDLEERTVIQLIKDLNVAKDQAMAQGRVNSQSH